MFAGTFEGCGDGFQINQLSPYLYRLFMRTLRGDMGSIPTPDGGVHYSGFDCRSAGCDFARAHTRGEFKPGRKRNDDDENELKHLKRNQVSV